LGLRRLASGLQETSACSTEARGNRQARVNSLPGPRRVLKRSENSPGLPRRVLDTQLLRAKSAWTS
jgi:hypothetical protein